ncbi:Sec-independent protein translocase TatA [Nocardiopsis gilva YIM 90087]|uniref:Sec-independent protein translocase protein TatA n=1 Tax=Nocardiopsis gilva YIM 90087 TaxID=1235441 RepID=A0A223SDH3_9ACTN|nr:Sec-independent protein translocase subunit TatA [Nocardiopsis gilva]ASU86211.1 Sec-independent protein translocase TatA [Nocardiopsis gilva YIM 90087]
MDAKTIALLVLIALVLFGAKKLPELARSLGRSARILKAESKGLMDEENGEQQSEKAAPAQQGQQASAPAPQAYDVHQGSANGQQPAAGGYPELPSGQRIVNENGEPVRRGYSD